MFWVLEVLLTRLNDIMRENVKPNMHIYFILFFVYCDLNLYKIKFCIQIWPQSKTISP